MPTDIIIEIGRRLVLFWKTYIRKKQVKYIDIMYLYDEWVYLLIGKIFILLIGALFTVIIYYVYVE